MDENKSVPGNQSFYKFKNFAFNIYALKPKRSVGRVEALQFRRNKSFVQLVEIFIG